MKNKSYLFLTNRYHIVSNTKFKVKNIFLLLLFFALNIEILPQWINQNSGFPNKSFFACYFLDYQNGWVVGEKVLKTTNGGENWNDKSSIISDTIIYSLFFFDTMKGIISGNQKIYKTINGGDSWNIVHNLPKDQILKSLYFIDSLKGWGVGGNLNTTYLSFTLDGGDNWTDIPMDLNYCLNSISYCNSLIGYAVGDSGLLLKTTDGGSTWFSTFLDPFPLKSIQFISELNGWIVGDNGVYRTLDGGLTWQKTFGPHNMRSVSFINNSLGWIGGQGIFMSSNGGVTWRVLNVNNVNSIFFVDNSNGWAVGNNGLILHTVTGGIPVTLSSFIASYLLENVTLNWSTASETNNYGFEIERSTNKKDWRLVGFKEGNGTTTEEHSYSFVDDLFGVNSYKLYYRLKQIDFNGSFEYSNV